MGSASRLEWIKAGHYEFARYGPEAIRIDRLSRAIDKSRSSFYHNFGDFEEFEEALFEYQIAECREFHRKQQQIEVFIPDFIELIVANKDITFFNKQLFIRQHEEEKYRETLKKSLGILEEKTAELWFRTLPMEGIPHARANRFYELIRAAGFARMDYDSFTYEHIVEIIQDINNSFRFLLDRERKTDKS